uniref:hypothetical protein n=1 Tax=Dysgonomonas macrotermitis TaxID=1346286 RepID=UPI000AAD683E
QNPLGVFHVDPKGDTNASGTSGYADDIFVNSKGYLGIGTLNPENHVHIDKGSAGSFIRIEDSSEGTGDKFLTSDAAGNGTWIPRVSLNGKVYRMTSPTEVPFYCYSGTDTPLLFNKLKPDIGSITNNPDGGYIRIDNDGSYIFTFRWWGAANSSVISGTNMKYKIFPANLKIRKVVGGIIQAGNVENVMVFANMIGSTGSPRFAFTVSMFAPNLKKDDLYCILINPATTTWILGLGLSSASDQFNNVIYFPSVMVYNI